MRAEEARNRMHTSLKQFHMSSNLYRRESYVQHHGGIQEPANPKTGNGRSWGAKTKWQTISLAALII